MTRTRRWRGLPAVPLLLLTATAASAAPPEADAPATIPTKVKPADAAWKGRPVRTVSALAPLPAAPPLDRWGGRADRKARATGFFRVEKAGDRWWLVDPDGGLFLHVGVNSFGPGGSERNKAALGKAFGSESVWAERTTDLLRDLGFNGAGSWSATSLIRATPKPLVYTIMGNDTRAGFLANFAGRLRSRLPNTGKGAENYPGKCLPVFHPEFEAFCDEFARPLAARRDDKSLLGYFSDNELPVGKLSAYLALPADDPRFTSTRAEAVRWWEERRGRDAARQITAADDDAWAAHVFERYFSVTTRAIRKYDPNHLCLGSRLFSWERRSEPVLRVAGRHLDVIAINYYGPWEPKPEAVAQWTEWSGKPVLISEFYAKGADSGFENVSGAGWLVQTQRDRGLFYQTYTLGLLEAKNCVGWHWFKYLDNDPEDKNADPSNRDSNKGIVTNEFQVYAPLAERMRALNRAVYALADRFDAATPPANRTAAASP